MSLSKYMMLSVWFLMRSIANEEILSIGFNKKEEREWWQWLLESNTHLVPSAATQPGTQQHNCKPWQAPRPAFKAKRKVEHEPNCETERAIGFEEGCKEKQHKLINYKA